MSMKKFYAFAMAAVMCTAAVPVCAMPVSAAEVLAEEEPETPDWLTTGTFSSFAELYDAKKDSSFKMSGKTYQRGIVFGYGSTSSRAFRETAEYDDSKIKKLTFYAGHVDNTVLNDGSIVIKLDGAETETIDIAANGNAKQVELDVSKASKLILEANINQGGGQIAAANFSIDGSQVEFPASAPKYSPPEQALAGSFNRLNTEIYSKTDKSTSFKMQGKTFYQGAVFSGGGYYDSNTSSLIINTENAKKIGFTVGHIDNSQMTGGTLKIFRDNVYDEEATVELTPSTLLQNVELDVSDTDCLMICMERERNSSYGIGDVSLDGKACAVPGVTPAAGKPEQLLKAAFNKTGTEIYEGADKSKSFKSIDRSYYQGIVFSKGITDKEKGITVSELMMNVEKYKEISFTALHVDNTGMSDAVLKIYLDGELTEDNTITLTGSQLPKEYKVDVSDVTLMRIVAEYKSDSKFALGSFAADTGKAAIACTVPNYTTPEKMLAAAFNSTRVKFYSKGDKSEAFRMRGTAYNTAVRSARRSGRCVFSESSARRSGCGASCIR